LSTVDRGILSQVLFNLYVDDLIKELQLNGDGCYVGKSFIGCIMYANDLLLLLSFITGLQRMIDTCSVYGTTQNIMFNKSKTFSVAISRTSNHNITSACMDNQPIPWVDQIKYLGVTFDASCSLNVNVVSIKA